MKLFKLVIVSLIVWPLTLLADDQKDKTDAVSKLLEQRLPSIEIQYIAPSVVPGLFEVMASGQLLYITEDGNYLFNGKLFDITNGIVSLSDETKERIDAQKNPYRKAEIAKLSNEDFIVFKAANEKYRISVFTDVDCGYCRQLHREMENYNDLGITVQYLGFPRAGIGSPSYAKLRSIWCADDRNEAMNNGKIKRQFGTDTCADPLSDHMNLVRNFGISGTPAIILDSGKLLPGFVEPVKLLEMLERDAATADRNISAGQ